MRALTLPFWLVQAGALALFSAVAIADVELPRSVPSAKLTQQVGLTEIAVEYECPAVKGRKIWGGVVPLGEVWAAGPGAATRLKFSKDVTVGDKAVPAGSYWLLAVPNKTTWTFVVNKSPDAITSARDYKPELDVARIQVSPKPTPRHERLMFSFSELTDDRASLDLEWETVRLPIPIQVNTTQQVLASINGLDGAWRSFANAARYMLEKKKDYDAGLKYIDQALALKDDWYCMWVKGALLAAKGDFAAARGWGVKARDLAKQVGNGGALEADLNKSIADWTRKGGPSSRDPQPLIKVGSDAPKKATGDEDGPSVTPPPFKAASGRDAGPVAPIEDPPVLRRARLRGR